MWRHRSRQVRGDAISSNLLTYGNFDFDWDYEVLQLLDTCVLGVGVGRRRRREAVKSRLRSCDIHTENN